MREFIDREHSIIDDYYKIMDRYTGRNAMYIIPKLKKLIALDPYFFDTYNSLVNLFYSIDNFEEADLIVKQASEKALKKIIDRKGNWPDRLEWGWVENRHIIRALLNQAISYWDCEKINEALVLLRKLFFSNPNDNIGASFYILAIRMGIYFFDFQLQFDRNGFYDKGIFEWFDAHYKSFSDDFEWWDKEMEKYETQDEEFDIDENEGVSEMKIFTIDNIYDKFKFSEDIKEIFDKINGENFQKEIKLPFQSDISQDPKIFQLKITLKKAKPPIWRRILISNQVNFHNLHLAIQEFFNWGNYHLHEFHFPHDTNPKQKICLLGLDPDGNIPENLDNNFLSYYNAQENEIRLCNIFSKNRQIIGYLYDFGDNWEHSIKLEKIYPMKKGFKGPLCVGGKRAAPPEDCGGIWGYQELLEILKDKYHPEYKEMKEWVGSTFNPEKMDLQINKMTPRRIEEEYGPSVPI